MINFNKNNLFFLAMITASCTAVSAAELEIQFTDGAEMNAPISGSARFNGSGSCAFSGSATDDVTLMAGSVKVSSAAPFNGGAGNAVFEGGSLQATAAMNLPPLVVNQPGTVTADADVNLAHPVSGTNPLTLAGLGVFTPTTDLSGSGNAVNITGAGGLSVASLTDKMPTGLVTVSPDSSVKIAAGLAVGPADVFAAGQLLVQSGSTWKMGNNASLDRYITVGSPS